VTDPTAPPAVLVERSGNVLIITINRPEARNAINAAVSIGVGEALKKRKTTRECAPW